MPHKTVANLPISATSDIARKPKWENRIANTDMTAENVLHRKKKKHAYMYNSLPLYTHDTSGRPRMD